MQKTCFDSKMAAVRIVYTEWESEEKKQEYILQVIFNTVILKFWKQQTSTVTNK